MTTKIISPAFLIMLISVPALTQDANTQLIEAGEKGETRKIEELLAAGAEVDAKDEEGVTALMHASAEGHYQSVEALLDAGADVDAHASIKGIQVFNSCLGPGVRDLEKRPCSGSAKTTVSSCGSTDPEWRSLRARESESEHQTT